MKGRNDNDQVFSSMQKFGQALLVPVAVLPATGLLYGIGMALKSSTLTSVAPWLLSGFWPAVAAMLSGVGSIIFSNLALLFAVGIAVGLAKKHDGTAGLAAVAGYLMMNQTISVLMGLTSEVVGNNTELYQLVLGIGTLRTGVFGGIFVGLIAAWSYNKFHTLKVPEYLGFFGAKRSVPIIATFLCIFLGGVLCIVWPPIQHGLNSFSAWMLEQSPSLGVFFYGVIVKLLNPLGLHTAFVTPFQYQFGTYVTLAGEVISGDKAMFFAQLADGVEVTAGIFQNGQYCMDMIACIGVGLAIYHEARPERKKVTAGILISACFTSFLTGITEPLLFSYLFVAPLCFLSYALINGVCYIVCYHAGIRLASTFASGFIDYVLIGILGNAPKWYLVLPLGIAFGVVEYVLFRFLIRKFNYQTPGREDDVNELTEGDILSLTDRTKAEGIIAAFGGKDNIDSITCCATRLRAKVKDLSLVRKEEFKNYGGKGVFEKGENYQVIIGLQVQNMLNSINEILNND